ncbi:hypothetical protein [Lacibacter cauensis]|nr:hypothetical protein [Lacibacter cauensis]
MKKIVAYFTGIYHSPRHLLLHVLFLLTIGFLYLERQHEDTIYFNIIRATRANQPQVPNDTVYIRHLMQTIHTMMYDRLAIFNNSEQLSFKNKLFNSVGVDLMYGHGACGGFSKVLSRSLQLSGYKVRIGQMKVNGLYGGHIIVEVFLPEQERWAVIDPLFLLTFPSKKDGGWADFAEIKQQWPAYSQLVPADYNSAFNYEDIRYANWEKIPVAGKLMYRSLALLLGEERAHGVSIRPYLLNMYAAWFKLMIVAYCVFCVFSYRRFSKQSVIRRSRFAAANL